MNVKILLLGIFLSLGAQFIIHADTAPGVEWHVANARIIEIAKAEPQSATQNLTSPPGYQRVRAIEVLKGVDTTQEFLLPSSALKPGQTALVLFQFQALTDHIPMRQSSDEVPSNLSVWPIDAAGNVDTGNVPAQSEDGWVVSHKNGIPLASVKKDIQASSPEEVGLNSQVVDALLFPGKFQALARTDAALATYVRFVIAILDLNRDVPALAKLLESPDSSIREAALKKLEAVTGNTLPRPQDENPASLHLWAQSWATQKASGAALPSRWPPVPSNMKVPVDFFPEPLLEALRKNDAAAFTATFAAWLDSGVMRDRGIQRAADTLDQALVGNSNLEEIIGASAYLPATPRMRPDVMMGKGIAAEDQMKVIALVARYWHYTRFVQEANEAKDLVASASPGSDVLRRAAFWELHDPDIETAGGLALQKLAATGEDESTQKFVLGLCLVHIDGDSLDAMRTEIRLKRQVFLAGLADYQRGHHDSTSQWITRMQAAANEGE